MNSRNIILLVSAVALVGAVIVMTRMVGQGTSRQASVTPSPTQEVQVTGKEASIVIAEQNNSGESGIATLTEENGKVVVIVKLTGAPEGIQQPSHLHTGSCAALGDIKYPLSNVSNGESETTLEVGMDQLKSDLPLALNVHESTTNPSVYVGCGDLKIE